MVGFCQPITGFTCKFGCYNGFSLSHLNLITCLNTGQWSNTPPICENLASECDVNSLKAIFKNGFINCNQNEKFQLICRFTCFSGYALSGNPILNCESNGKFNTSPPTCILVENTNNPIEYNHSPLTSPNFIYTKPFNNYLATSNSIQCPQLNHLKSGSTNCECSGGMQFGCTCRFYCNDDYYLIG